MTTGMRFKVRGEDLVGTEVFRIGDQVTLMCAPQCWPFVRERSFDRSALVRLDGANGDDEPKVAKRRGRKVAA